MITPEELRSLMPIPKERIINEFANVICYLMKLKAQKGYTELELNYNFSVRVDDKKYILNDFKEEILTLFKNEGFEIFTAPTGADYISWELAEE